MTVTNESGEYSFAALEPGSYRLNASLAGFKPVVLTGIRIGTQQFVTLDLKLEVGALAEAVSVTADVPLIETSNASTGTVLDTLALETLPAPGRNAFMIGVSVPTVIPSGDTQFNRQQDQTNASLISLGGGTRRGNNYTLDGVPITDMRNRAVANPTIEALEDVKVQVHTYDAEMGRTGGGVFNTTLKSGSNDFHGFLSNSSDLGGEKQLLQREGRYTETKQSLLSGRRRGRWSNHKEQDVLLVRGRGLSRYPDAKPERDHADGSPMCGRFFGSH